MGRGLSCGRSPCVRRERSARVDVEAAVEAFAGRPPAALSGAGSLTLPCSDC